jgi:hypothetical protein
VKHVLSIVEYREEAEVPEGQTWYPDGTERLKLQVDTVTPDQLQEIIAVLYRTPRKPRKDAGTKRTPKPAQDSQNNLPGT